jgi:hypothetical protein
MDVLVFLMTLGLEPFVYSPSDFQALELLWPTRQRHFRLKYQMPLVVSIQPEHLRVGVLCVSEMYAYINLESPPFSFRPSRSTFYPWKRGASPPALQRPSAAAATTQGGCLKRIKNINFLFPICPHVPVTTNPVIAEGESASCSKLFTRINHVTIVLG